MSKNYKILLVLAAGLLFLASCKESIYNQRLGDYATRATYAGLGRSGAVSFVIGTKAFVGTGYNGPNNIWMKDFWAYDAINNSWSKIADFPGEGRLNGVAFSSNGKGYVGTGYDGNDNVNFNDFYSYDPNSDTWSQIANLPGPPRRAATAFQVNDIGYVGLGLSTDTSGLSNGLGDFYSYNPSTNTWTQIASYPGFKVQRAFSFTIGNYAYVGGGVANGQPDFHFFRYDPSNNIWIQKPSLDSNTMDVKRYDCASFASQNYGYIVQGATSLPSSCYEYNPANSVWTRKTDMEVNVNGGGAREGLIGFAINTSITNGYSLFMGLGTTQGTTSPAAGAVSYADFWAFDPFITRILNN